MADSTEPRAGLPIELRSHPWLGALMIAAGALQFLAGVIGSQFGLFLGVLFVVLGVLQLNARPIIVEKGQVKVRNALGMTLKTVEYQAITDLVIDNGVLFHAAGAQRQRITALSPIALRSDDIEALRRYVNPD